MFCFSTTQNMGIKLDDQTGGGEAPAADSTQGDICQYLLEVWVISTGKLCWQNWAGRVNAAQRFRAVAALLATDYDPA